MYMLKVFSGTPILRRNCSRQHALPSESHCGTDTLCTYTYMYQWGGGGGGGRGGEREVEVGGERGRGGGRER